MEVLGKTTINPILFYSGKIAGFVPAIISGLALCNCFHLERNSFWGSHHIAAIIFILSMIFIFVSLSNLGKSTRVGIPTEETILKHNGLFKISRNPIYVGLHLLNIASLLIYCNVYMVVLVGYSIIIYHYIILGEERFLENRFGKDYSDYKNNVRRYL